jgi:UDP-N-acetylmuramyl pentapeptide phosphotransferase/UDP-N-acetylglucosamine-1-phosphate transferase
MEYIFIFLGLFLLLLLYFKVANHYNIIDKPNHRSAHTEVTLRGGGIIFWIAAFLYFFQNMQTNYLFFLGITIVSFVSFWDDVKSLPNKFRVLAHFLAISLVFYALNIFIDKPLWAILLLYVLFIGVINAYNFMDGINGITGLYTLTVLSSLWYVNKYIFVFVDSKFIIYPIVASVVFLYFNFRRKAKCFAGDVGSIGIAFWIVFLLLKLILSSNSLLWLLFLAVYGADTVCTIMHRIYLKENIFEAHRHHFYQILSNDYKIQHRVVALIYASLQFFISFIVCLFRSKLSEVVLFVLILIPLILIYLAKFYLLKKLWMKN